MSILPEGTVATAEALLQLVKSLTEPDVNPESQFVYDTKVQVQHQCDELLRQVMGRLEFTAVLAESCQESQALHLVSSLGVADVIGDGVVTLRDISKEVNADERALGVAMSCILGRGYFEEVNGYGSRTYRNNSFSEILREDHPTSMKSAIGLSGDEAFRATSRLLDAAMAGVQTTPSQKSAVTGANIAFGFESSIFKWMALPDNVWRAQRVGRAMQQYHRMANSNVRTDYPWHNLTSPIVDCGGGIGTMERNLLSIPSNSHLRFKLFDLPSTIENAKKIWSQQLSEKVSQVTFVGGDFMAATLEETKIPQNHTTYMIAHVLHDWTDTEVVRILRNVRAAMCASTTSDAELVGKRLLLVEMLLRPSAARFVRTTSMQLLALSNGITRTQAEFEELLDQAGFKVTLVHHMRAVDSVIEAVPVPC